MSEQKDVQLTIASKQNALTVVDVVLELPTFYTLEDIVQFLDEQHLLALFKEDVALENTRGERLDSKRMLRDVTPPGSSVCKLIAVRKELLSQIVIDERLGSDKSLPLLIPQFRQLDKSSPIVVLPPPYMKSGDISMLSESKVEAVIELQADVHDHQNSYQIKIKANSFESIQDVMPRLIKAINLRNKNEEWTLDGPYRISSKRKTLVDLTRRLDEIPGLIVDRVARLRLDVEYLGGSP